MRHNFGSETAFLQIEKRILSIRVDKVGKQTERGDKKYESTDRLR